MVFATDILAFLCLILWRRLSTFDIKFIALDSRISLMDGGGFLLAGHRSPPFHHLLTTHFRWFMFDYRSSTWNSFAGQNLLKNTLFHKSRSTRCKISSGSPILITTTLGSSFPLVPSVLASPPRAYCCCECLFRYLTATALVTHGVFKHQISREVLLLDIL